jgi:site-specific recombinase XerD
MQDAFDDFMRYCRLERRLAPLTCSAYERDVGVCLRFLAEQGINNLRLVRPPDLRAFLAEESQRRPALGSQARTVAALKCFFRFLCENEYLERDPAHALRTPKKSEALPDVLDRRELARLLAVVEDDEVWERKFPGRRERDRLLLALFAFAGLRRSELLGLDWDDVDLDRRLLRIRKAKAAGSARSRSTPRSSRCSPTTWA